jgi:hypothetical protein
MNDFSKAKAAAKKVLKTGGCCTAAEKAAQEVLDKFYPTKPAVVKDMAWQAVLAARY